jgi:hypothetical protein
MFKAEITITLPVNKCEKAAEIFSDEMRNKIIGLVNGIICVHVGLVEVIECYPA